MVEGWSEATVSSVFRSKRNNTLSRDKLSPTNGVTKNIHYGDVLTKLQSVVHVDDGIIPYIVEERGDFGEALDDGDVIIADTAEDDSVGKACEIIGAADQPTVSGLHTIALSPQPGLFSIGYLGFYLNGADFRKQLIAYAHGTKVTSVNKADVLSLTVAIPPLEEQKTIAEALGDMDELIASLEALVKKKRDIKQGVIHDLLTGKRSLPGSDGKLEILKVGEIGALRRGAGISRAEAYSGNKPCIRYGDLYTSYGPYTTSTVGGVSSDVAEKSTRIQYGDIVFAATGETKEDIGRCTAYLIGRDGYASGDTLVLIPSIDVNPIYLAYVLNSQPAQEQKAKLANGDTVVHLSLTALASVSVELPSKHDQDAIANVILDFDASIAALEQKLAKYRLIKQGMMEELLSGRIRLV